MIYIISEDTGSGLLFWKIFFETYYDDYQFITNEKRSGNSTLVSQLNEALEKADIDDEVFIAFDKVYSTEGFDTGDFLNIAIEKCRRKAVNLYVTSYFCFEEIYLSYPELEEMLKNDGKDKSLTETAFKIREMLKNDQDYFQYDKQVKELIEHIRKDAAKNREHFADAALYYLTKSIRNGYFTIDKSKKTGISKCWTMTCGDICNASKKDMSYMCEKCCYSQKQKTRKDKLDDLCERSCIASDQNKTGMRVFAVPIG